MLSNFKFSMFHWIMQLSDDYDDDRPPGFELLGTELGCHAQPSLMSSSVLMVEKPTKQIGPSYEDMKYIVEHIENELHLSAKSSLTEYVGSFVNEEVSKRVNSSKEKNSMKVILRHFNGFFLLPPGSCFTITFK